MKINEITLNPQTFPTGDPSRLRVGEAPVEGGHVVEKITFHPSNNLFNKGREVGTGSYAVFFEEIPERRIIAADAVSSIEVVTEKKKTDDNHVPELPEG